jgi:SAM-dependent methyltransferase
MGRVREWLGSWFGEGAEMHQSVMEFVNSQLWPGARAVEGKDILEVGSLDVNGSPRDFLEMQGPASYTGLDIRPGPGVDLVADICEYQGPDEQYDVILCLYTLEHIAKWTRAVVAMKHLLRPQGMLVLTVPGPGFWLHEHPGDYWRFTQEMIRQAFQDLSMVIQKDPQVPGVMMVAWKPDNWEPKIARDPVWGVQAMSVQMASHLERLKWILHTTWANVAWHVRNRQWGRILKGTRVLRCLHEKV